MKQKKNEIKVTILIPIAFICVGILLAFYIIQFHDGLSDNQSDWGNFGSFISGILGPLFSLFSMIVILHTVRAQASSDREIATNTKLQERLEELYLNLSDMVSSYLSLIHGSNLSYDIENDGVENKKIINGKVSEGQNAWSKAFRLSRLCLGGEDEIEVRIMLSFLKKFFSQVKNTDGSYLTGTIHVEREEGDDSEFPAVEPFIDYYSETEVMPWFDRVLQVVLDKIDIAKDANKPEYFGSEDYLGMKKENALNVTGIRTNGLY